MTFFKIRKLATNLSLSVMADFAAYKCLHCRFSITFIW